MQNVQIILASSNFKILYNTDAKVIIIIQYKTVKVDILLPDEFFLKILCAVYYADNTSALLLYMCFYFYL